MSSDPAGQVIRLPDACPDCGRSSICVTGGRAHCHDWWEEYECGWWMPLHRDANASSYTYVYGDEPTS